MTTNFCCVRLLKPHITGIYEKSEFISAPSSESKVKAGAKEMYAIIVTGGKQYKVENGDVIYIEKLDVNEDETVTFDKVVAVNDDNGLKAGAPYIEGCTVTGKVLKNGKAKKITVFTYKPKKSSSRKLGHRQPYTKVQIEAINA